MFPQDFPKTGVYRPSLTPKNITCGSRTMMEFVIYSIESYVDNRTIKRVIEE